MTRHIRVKGQPTLTMCGAEPTTDDLHAVLVSAKRCNAPDVCVDCATAHEIETVAA